MLLKKQRNELFNILASKNLNPSDFSFSENKDNIYRITYQESKLKFVIKLTGDTSYEIIAFPKIDKNINSNYYEYSYYWNQLAAFFKIWAEEVKEEIETPDLWKESEITAKIFTNNSDLPNEKFNNHELRELESRLRSLEQKIADSDIPEAAKESLTETVQAAPEKASFFTKKDWKDWIVGNIARQAVSLSLTQDHVNTIWALFKSTFNTLFLN